MITLRKVSDSDALLLLELYVSTRQNQSDTPRKAGGLMSWAASKAVGLRV
jgi:hypothetical protein